MNRIIAIVFSVTMLCLLSITTLGIMENTARTVLSVDFLALKFTMNDIERSLSISNYEDQESVNNAFGLSTEWTEHANKIGAGDVMANLHIAIHKFDRYRKARLSAKYTNDFSYSNVLMTSYQDAVFTFHVSLGKYVSTIRVTDNYAFAKTMAWLFR